MYVTVMSLTWPFHSLHEHFKANETLNYSDKLNSQVKNPNWQEADQLATNKHSHRFEPEKKSLFINFD